MKRKFNKLPKSEQEAIELEYHSMNPEDFDSLMSQAKAHTPKSEQTTLRHLISTATGRERGLLAETLATARGTDSISSGLI